jgi:hypothetical protein
VAENRNAPTAFNKSPPHPISIKCTKPFIRYADKPVYGLTQIRPYYEPIRLKSGTTGHIFMEGPIRNSSDIKRCMGEMEKVHSWPYLIKSDFIMDKHGRKSELRDNEQ